VDFFFEADCVYKRFRKRGKYEGIKKEGKLFKDWEGGQRR
jgi:hypothetical protein